MSWFSLGQFSDLTSIMNSNDTKPSSGQPSCKEQFNYVARFFLPLFYYFVKTYQQAPFAPLFSTRFSDFFFDNFPFFLVQLVKKKVRTVCIGEVR